MLLLGYDLSLHFFASKSSCDNYFIFSTFQSFNFSVLPLSSTCCSLLWCHRCSVSWHRTGCSANWVPWSPPTGSISIPSPPSSSYGGCLTSKSHCGSSLAPSSSSSACISAIKDSCWKNASLSPLLPSCYRKCFFSNSVARWKRLQGKKLYVCACAYERGILILILNNTTIRNFIPMLGIKITTGRFSFRQSYCQITLRESKKRVPSALYLSGF